mgnify:CR=1 FL=1
MNRIAFEIVGHPIYWYGIMFALGIFAALWTCCRRTRVPVPPGFTPISADQFLNAAPWIIIGAILGARALFVITYWDQYFSGRPLLEIFNLFNGGLVYFGGLIGAILMLIIYLIKNHILSWSFFDLIAPSLALGHAFGRIGCFINGCCYGHPTECFLGFSYPKWHETFGTPVHPVQLYESASNLLLFGILEYAFRHRKYEGQTAALYLIAYGVLRTIMELFRGDVGKVFLIFSQAQCIALLITLIGFGILIWLKIKKSSSR